MSEEHLRMMPHSADAEQALLGTALMSPQEAWPVVAPLVDAFYVPAHRAIGLAIGDLVDAGGEVSLIALQELLTKRDEIAKLGGPGAVADLVLFRDSHDVPIGLLGHYAALVRNAATLRGIIQVCTEAATSGYAMETAEAAALLDRTEERILALRERDDAGEGPVTWRKVALEVSTALQEAMQEGKKQGISTGLSKLDAMTGGFIRKEYWVVAARPSMGKTTLAMELAAPVAASGYSVLIFSAEMDRKRLMLRNLAKPTGIENRRLSDANIARTEMQKLMTSLNQQAQLPIWVDDEPNIRVTDLCARARRLNRETDVRLVVIDYLQLLESGRNEREREREVANMSKALKALAKQIDATVIVCAQLNRDCERRKGGRPRPSDLRESGGIEQDADVIVLIGPDQGPEEEEESNAPVIDALLIVGKARNGATGDVPVTFQKHLSWFEERGER